MFNVSNYAEKTIRGALESGRWGIVSMATMAQSLDSLTEVAYNFPVTRETFVTSVFREDDGSLHMYTEQVHAVDTVDSEVLVIDSTGSLNSTKAANRVAYRVWSTADRYNGVAMTAEFIEADVMATTKEIIELDPNAGL